MVLPANLKNGRTKSCGCIIAKRSEDIIGKKYGRLIVSGIDHKSDKNAYYRCRCDCGNDCIVMRSRLLNGETRSCGCLKNEVFKENYENMREAAGQENGTIVSLFASSKLPFSNRSGIKGVSYDRERDKWFAQISYKGKRYHLGRFDTAELAGQARMEAEKKLGITDMVEEYKKNKKENL